MVICRALPQGNLQDERNQMRLGRVSSPMLPSAAAPAALKYRSDADPKPYALAYAASACSIASFVTPYGLIGACGRFLGNRRLSLDRRTSLQCLRRRSARHRSPRIASSKLSVPTTLFW